MGKRTVRLTKEGHDYVFCYVPGDEGQVVEEIIQLVRDAEKDFDWEDAATLGFQITRNVAIDCCTEIMSPAHVQPGSPDRNGVERGAGGDDAKDGPCTNHNLP